MLRHQVLSLLLLAAFFALSLNCATAEDSNFEFGGKAGKTMAIVTKEQFDLKVEVGLKSDYPGPKIFKLLIGECAVEIKAESYSDGITVRLREGGTDKPAFDNLKLISVKNSDGVTFHGDTSTSIACPVNFGEKTCDKYYIPVELSGDVPMVFKLSSTDVKMGEPPFEKKADGVGLGARWIAGIVTGGVLLFLVICVSVGFGIFKFYKNKKLRIGDELKTAKSMETLPGTLETKSTQAAPTSESKKETPKENHDKGESESAKSSKNVSEKPSNTLNSISLIATSFACKSERYKQCMYVVSLLK